MSYHNSGKKSLPWGVVVLIIIIFWPVGLYLTFKKLSIDNKFMLNEGKGLRVTGWVFVGFEIIFLINDIFNPNISYTFGTRIFTLLLFGVSGVCMLHLSNKLKRKARRYKKYLALISNNYEISVDHIAAAIPIEYDSAVDELNTMIDKGFFENAYIDDANRILVLPQNKMNQLLAQQQEYENALLQNKISQLHSQISKVITCNSCGAKNKVFEGMECKCEYCGTILN